MAAKPITIMANPINHSCENQSKLVTITMPIKIVMATPNEKIRIFLFISYVFQMLISSYGF
ncbi:hypothetical protein [Nitrosopumilus piranensis]|nr:hypothetical protein [Nitrosopumilus piranensis]